MGLGGTTLNPQALRAVPSPVSTLIRCSLRLGAVGWLLFASVVESDTPTTLDAGDLSTPRILSGWRFQPGDDPAWAAAAFDDRAWPVVDARMNQPPESGWPGIGWFRLHLQLAPDVDTRELAGSLVQRGAAEVYLDGRRIAARGSVDEPLELPPVYRSDPWPVPLEAGGRHVLAVRYTNPQGNALFPRGFALHIGPTHEIARARDRFLYLEAQEAMLLAGGAFMLGLLHLLLFAGARAVRANLAFAGFCLAVAGMFWSDSMAGLGFMPEQLVVQGFRATLACSMLVPLFGVSLVVHAFREGRFPRHAPLLVIGVLAMTAWTWLQPGWPNPMPLIVVQLVVYLEMIRLLVQAIRERRTDAWLIGVGATVLVGCYVVGLLTAALGRGSERWLLSVGLVALLLSISVYLARSMVRMRRERDRQSAELDAARALQLALLPAPRLEHGGGLLTCRMWTATEVGGDYYDYRIEQGGSLLLAVGDATGHGLDCAQVVAAVKTLFQSLPDGTNLSEALGRLSCGLKGLGLRRRNMALALARIDGRTLRFASAAMPPALWWRTDGTIEEIVASGPPLGTGLVPRYETREVTLESGDAVLWMSDGIPESADAEGEPLGYPQVAEGFGALMQREHTTPSEVLDGLADLADRHAPDQDDDRTLVLLQVG